MFSINLAFFIRMPVSSLSLSTSRLPRLTDDLLAFCGDGSFDRFDLDTAFGSVSGVFCLVTDDFDCVDVVIVVVVDVVVVFFDCDVNMYALMNSLSDDACGDDINDFDTDTIE